MGIYILRGHQSMKGEGGLEKRLQVERCDDLLVLRAQLNGLCREEGLAEGPCLRRKV